MAEHSTTYLVERRKLHPVYPSLHLSFSLFLLLRSENFGPSSCVHSDSPFTWVKSGDRCWNHLFRGISFLSISRSIFLTPSPSFYSLFLSCRSTSLRSLSPRTQWRRRMSAKGNFPSPSLSHISFSSKYTTGLGQERIAFCECNEDAVSMALTAFDRLMKRNNLNYSQVTPSFHYALSPTFFSIFLTYRFLDWKLILRV